MQTHFPPWLRIAGAAVVLLGAASVAGTAQTLQGSGPVTAAVLGNESDADTVRITHTADGQLFLRLYGSQSAMLLIDEDVGRMFVSKVRDYLDKAAKGCDPAAADMPRLASARVHRTGVNGIAFRCEPAPDGAPKLTALVTRPASEGGPPLEPLVITTDAKAVRAFVRDIERLMGGAQR